MKQIRTFMALLVALALVAAACGSDDDDGGSASGDASAQVMAAALVELVTVDHTFGQGPPPFTTYLVLDATDPGAGAEPGGPSRPLTAVERTAIEAALSSFGAVQWIEDQQAYVTDDLRPTVDGAAILGVGEPEIAGDEALAPISLWCGGLCGTWFTYTLEAHDGSWNVTGTTGPIAVS